jgi:hypothetical protein
MLAIEPGAARPFGSSLGDQGIEVGASFVGQSVRDP